VRRRSLLLTAAMCLALVSPAAALDFDGFKLIPSLRYTGEYDDNVLRQSSGAKSDFISTVSTGLAAQLRLGGSDQLSAAYRNEILRYVERGNLDTERHFFDLAGSLTFTKLSFFAKEKFASTDDFPSSELATRIKRNENEAGGGADWDAYGRWGLGVLLNHFYADYQGRDFEILDRSALTLGGRVYYRFTPRLRVFVEYNRVDETYASAVDRDNTRQRALLGLEGNITERLSSTAKLGYERTHFETGGQSDLQQFVTSSDTKFQPLERLSFRLLMSRSVQASAFVGNSQFVSTDAQLSADYAFRPRLFFLPRITAGVDEFPQRADNAGTSEKRTDFRYGFGLGIRYQIQKWLHVDANYDYTRRDSNFDQFDYADNRVFGSVGVSF